MKKSKEQLIISNSESATLNLFNCLHYVKGTCSIMIIRRSEKRNLALSVGLSSNAQWLWCLPLLQGRRMGGKRFPKDDNEELQTKYNAFQTRTVFMPFFFATFNHSGLLSRDPRCISRKLPR